MTGSAPLALLLDLDGTLAASHGALQRGYEAFLTERNATPSAAEFKELDGPTLDAIVAILRERHRLDGSAQSLEAAYREAVHAAYANVEPAHGAERLIETAHGAGARLALVTSAPRPLAERFLKGAGWSGRFETVVTGEDAAPKPDPAPYERALMLLDLAPAGVVAIEDSPAGVAAAAGAGIEVIGVTADAGRAQELLEAGAARVVADLDAATALVLGAGAHMVQAGPVRLVCDANPPPLVPEVQRDVDDIWARAQSAEPHLHDGELPAVITREGPVLHVGFIPYRDHYARVREPRLRPRLPFPPVGVSGVLFAGRAGVVVARRSHAVTEYAGCWELVPSGSFDRGDVGAGSRIDFVGALSRELEEEVGVPASLIRSSRVIGIVHDLRGDVLDVCVELWVDASTDQVISGMARGSEYTDVRILDPAVCRRFLENADDVVPTSRVLAQRYG